MEQKCCINTNITLGESELFNHSNKSLIQGTFRLTKKALISLIFGKHPAMFLFVLYKCSLPPMPCRHSDQFSGLRWKGMDLTPSERR